MEICHIMEHLDHQDSLILQMVQQLQEQNQLLASQDTMILKVTERLETQHERLKEQREELFKRMSDLSPNGLQNALHEMVPWRTSRNCHNGEEVFRADLYEMELRKQTDK